MAGFVERISVIIDTKVDGALSGIKGFRSAVAEADGFTNKFKAGWKNASAQVSANAGMLAATAGTALVAFGVKAVEAFQNTAKAAVDMAKATGLSVEQASRWIAVGDDFGVTADQLTAAMARLGKNMDAKAMAEYGIATRDSSGQARDANDIFLDVLDTLNNTAPSERAKVGMDLLGKGFTSIAPLIGETRAEYEKMLSTVEDGQVVTDKEAKKSEKMRLAQDKLTDAFGEFTLATGEAASGLAPLVERIAEVVALATELGAIDSVIPAVDKDGALDKLGSAAGSMRALMAAALETDDAVAFLMEHGFTELGATRALADYKIELENAAIATTRFGDVLDWVRGPTEDAADATKDLEGKSAKLFGALDEVTEAAIGTTEAMRELQGVLTDLDTEEAALNLADQFRETKQSADDAFYAAVSGAEDAQEALGDAEQSTIDLKREVIKYATEVAGLPAEQVTSIIALIDEGKLAEAELKLKQLVAYRMASIGVSVNTGGGSSGGGSGGGKSGSSSGGNAKTAAFDDGGRGQRDSAAPIVVQLMLDGRAIAEITAYQEAQKRGTR